MVADKIKPPKFDGNNFSRWSKLVKMWSSATTIEPDKQGPILIMCMSGKAQDIALGLPDHSIENILQAMANVYGDRNSLVKLYEEFDSFLRLPNQSIREYLQTYEQKCTELEGMKLSIPDIIKSVRLLKGSNISENEKKMVKMASGPDMKFEATVKAIRSLEDEYEKITSQESLAVKQETEELTFMCQYCQEPRLTRVKKCYRCRKPGHFAKDCPKNQTRTKQDYNNSYFPPQRFRRKIYYEEVSDEEDGELMEDLEEEDEERNNHGGGLQKSVFFQSDVGNEIEDILLVGETVSHAVLDCGASKTVCGLEWYTCFIESLREEQREQSKEHPSDTIFKFGVGKLKAKFRAAIPVNICDEEVTLNVHVVDTDIPLLLSRSSMKSLGMNIDLKNDAVIINGKSFDLKVTISGHYTLQVLKPVEEVLMASSIETTEPKRIAEKLHKRFAHASSNQITELLKNAKIKNRKDITNELQKIENSCDFCIRHKRASPKPDVCLPLANHFNELVSMDLKMINENWVLHCIDYVTRFSAAHTVRNKSADEIIEKFLLIWIAVFGPPQKVLSDNGCEFTNAKIRSLCSIAQIFTAAEAPFSNGICERHNALIGKMTIKIMKEERCKLQVALMWAVHAKNSLLNIFGFSPYQLVFGFNPNIPGNSNNKLPALTTIPPEEHVREHLNCLHKARQAYIEAENCNRIKRALAGRVYAGTYQQFCSGDEVYFKRLGMEGWQGPGTVIAQQGTSVIIKTGSKTLIKLHPCKIMLKEEADKDCSITPITPASPVPEETPNNENVADNDDYSDSDSEVEAEGFVPTPQNETRESGSTPTHQNQIGKQQFPKIGDTIKYKLKDETDYKLATIISRATKASASNAGWFNVKHPSDQSTISVNMKEVDWLLDYEHDIEVENFANLQAQETFVLTSIEKDDSKFTAAKLNEIENWKQFQVYEEVNKSDYPNSEVLSCRWVTEEKQEEEGIRYKARLVIRGFEETDAPQADSPTANKSIIRLFIAISNILGFEIKALDVKRAFLQSNAIKRTILVKPPKEFRTNKEKEW